MTFEDCVLVCHSAAGELEQIQSLLGHVSVQTTEKYLRCKQRLREAVNDKIGIEPGANARCGSASSGGFHNTGMAYFRSTSVMATCASTSV
jgi:hypothetical protein